MGHESRELRVHATDVPLIVDVEASGFGHDSYPIEIGVALDGGRRFCTLILPEGGWIHWDHEAEALHGITRDVLGVHGRPVGEVASQLNALLAGRTVYSDGWVVDKTWIITLFHAARQRMAFHVSPLELILSEHQMSIWHATKELIINQVDPVRHRASNDAWIVQETYRLTRRPVGVS